MNDRVPDLLVDIQTVQGGFFGNRGIRRYALGFARALLDRGAVRALLLNPSRPWLEAFPSDMRNVRELSWATRRTMRELTADGAATYLMTSPFEQASPIESTVPSLVVESGTPIVVVLYDLIPEIVDVYPPSLMPAYRARRQFLKEADLILTLSEHVRQQAVRRLGVPVDRTAVIGAAVSDFFRPRAPGEEPRHMLAAELPRITRPFVLSVTGWLAHKNVEGLIAAWSRVPREVRRQFQLVLTCALPPQGEGVWSEQAAVFGLGPDEVVVTGQVGDQVVRALYQQAELLVLPSYEEGFGLPILEAARCGCPAITSSTSSLPEVLDWAPSTFPPEDVDQMAERIERGLVDPLFRADLRAAGNDAAERHTWERVAERTVEATARVQAVRGTRRPPPARVALVGRFTPPTSSSSEVADRIAALLPSPCRVDRFDTGGTSRPSSDVPRGNAEARFYPARALGRVRDPWGYDTIVYVVDAQPGQEILELARAHPGLVWYAEQPDDHRVAAQLTREATAIVRPDDVTPLAVDPGPFGRAPISVVAPDRGSSEAHTLLEAVGLPPPVTRPS